MPCAQVPSAQEPSAQEPRTAGGKFTVGLGVSTAYAHGQVDYLAELWLLPRLASVAQLRAWAEHK